jgi:hypothetical protein
MGGVRFVGACMAATLLVLSGQETMAQGSLPVKPQSVDDIMTPYPLGPLQKFGDWSPGSEARFTRLERAPLPRRQQVDAARSGRFQAQRRPNPSPGSRQAAVRSSPRQHELQRGVAQSGSVLALAPINQERAARRQFCFPSATIHFQQNERDNCSVGAPPSRGRFEELLGR